MTTPFKKILKSLAFCAVTVLSTTAFTSPTFAQANAATAEARFSVDIKDATLLDALELVFMAAGNPSRNIDPSAKSVRLGVVSFKNQPWRDIVRTLTSLNQFRFSRRDGVWIVEPRVGIASIGGAFTTTTRHNAGLGTFEVKTRSSAQTTTGTTQTLPIPAPVQSNNPWTIIALQHSYAGFIATFFQGGTVISTQETIVPAAAQTTKLGGQLLNRAGYDLDLGGTGGGSGSGGNNNNRNGSTGSNQGGTNR